MLRNYHLRAEVSGEFDVDDDGTISIPLLGQINAAGSPLQNVKKDVGARFEETLGHVGIITLGVVEHQPIYVIGPVKNPGSFKFAPEMTVLHGVALAGGFERSEFQMTQMLENMHELERKQRTAELLKPLFARDALLKAELAGTTIVMPKQLLEIASPEEANVLVGTEGSRRRLSIETQRMEEESLKAAIQNSQQSIEVRQKQLQLIGSVVSSREDRVGKLKAIRSSGDISTPILNSAESELSEAMTRQEDAVAGLQEVKSRLLDAEAALAKFKVGQKLELDKTISELESSIAQEWKTYESSSAAVATLGSAVTEADNGLTSGTVGYVILRKTAHGIIGFEAPGSCSLQPGDLIRVRVQKGAGSNNGSIGTE
jgi:protein involved in polysaccharide export with SLBB domain